MKTSKQFTWTDLFKGSCNWYLWRWTPWHRHHWI